MKPFSMLELAADCHNSTGGEVEVTIGMGMVCFQCNPG